MISPFSISSLGIGFGASYLSAIGLKDAKANGRSGWFRLWLSDLQQKSLQERDKELHASPETKQGVEAVPVVVKKAVTKKKPKKVVVEQEKPLAPVVFLRTPTPPMEPTVQEQIANLPWPEYSITAFQNVVDLQKHHQEVARKHHQRRRNNAMILLLAA